jgi:hypothetical protein
MALRQYTTSIPFVASPEKFAFNPGIAFSLQVPDKWRLILKKISPPKKSNESARADTFVK